MCRDRPGRRRRLPVDAIASPPNWNLIVAAARRRGVPDHDRCARGSVAGLTPRPAFVTVAVPSGPIRMRAQWTEAVLADPLGRGRGQPPSEKRGGGPLNIPDLANRAHARRRVDRCVGGRTGGFRRGHYRLPQSPRATTTSWRVPLTIPGRQARPTHISPWQTAVGWRC